MTRTFNKFLIMTIVLMALPCIISPRLVLSQSINITEGLTVEEGKPISTILKLIAKEDGEKLKIAASNEGVKGKVVLSLNPVRPDDEIAQLTLNGFSDNQSVSDFIISASGYDTKAKKRKSIAIQSEDSSFSAERVLGIKAVSLTFAIEAGYENVHLEVSIEKGNGAWGIEIDSFNFGVGGSTNK